MKILDRLLDRIPVPWLVAILLLCLIYIAASGPPYTRWGREIKRDLEQQKERILEEVNRQLVAETLAKIELSDGVSSSEAMRLKYVYMLEHADGQFSEAPVQKVARGWKFEIYFFRPETPDTTVFVSHEGVVSAYGYPAVDYRDR